MSVTGAHALLSTWTSRRPDRSPSLTHPLPETDEAEDETGERTPPGLPHREGAGSARVAPTFAPARALKASLGGMARGLDGCRGNTDLDAACDMALDPTLNATLDAALDAAQVRKPQSAFRSHPEAEAEGRADLW